MEDSDPLLEWLYGLQKHGIKLGLQNIEMLLEKLGNPQKSLRFIHVAGTDGKGSTSACMESILRSSGFRTGLYTSPHLIHFNERISVSGENISDSKLSEIAFKIKPIVEEMQSHGIQCTFFEVTTALAFQFFKESDTDICVIEVGMGGRFDATNVLVPEVSVICNISMDHTEYLGDTIEKIAYEKAGIIKPGVPCVTLNPSPAFDVISEISEKHGSDLIRVFPENIKIIKNMPEGLIFSYKGKSYEVSIPGGHQAKNAAMAMEAVALLSDYDTKIKDNVKKGLMNVSWPCRMQKLNDLPIILDVSHTRAGSFDLAADISEIYGKVLPVFGVLNDKDMVHILENMSLISDRIVITSPDSIRAESSEELMPVAKKYFSDVFRTDSVAEAMEIAMNIRDEENILVTGSFYMAADVIKWLKKTSV